MSLPARSRLPPTFLVGISCISASILLVELGLTRIFSVTTWYHFAFLAISLALLGLSASGVFVQVTPKLHAPERLRRQMAGHALLFSALTSTVAIVFLRTRAGAAFDSRQWHWLVLLYLLGAAPFFAGGMCLALAVSRCHFDVSRIYSADLLGAALGCLIFIPTLNYFGGPGPLLGATCLGALGGFLFAGGAQRRVPAALVGVGAAAAVALAAQAWSPFLDAVYAKGGSHRKTLFSRWNSYSRVAVYPSSMDDWGLSDRYQGARPDNLVMDIDGSAATPILLARNLGDVQQLRWDVTSFGHRLVSPGAHTLVIGPGGGRDLWTSLLFGAREVTGVEINSIIVEQVMQRFGERAGNIYHRPGVSVFVDDGRNFVARSVDRYDLIQASLVDTWAATAAGAFSLTENNLYTVEAFMDYFRHLKPEGVLSVSRWLLDGLRLVAVARSAAEGLGWPGIADRMFAVAHRANKIDPGVRVATFVFTASPLRSEQVSSLISAANELGFDIIYAPAVASEPARGMPDYVELATTADPAGTYRRQPKDISPVTDDRPFFFQNAKRTKLARYISTDVFRESDGISVLLRLLVISALLVALFVLLPLVFASVKGPNRDRLPLGILAYFGCLGTGFMLIEIGLMQRFVLFLGHPVYSLTVILFTLLAGGGLGAMATRLWIARPRVVLRFVLLAIASASVLGAIALPPLLTHLLGLARPLRILASTALLLPVGFLLGIPLPTALALLAARRSNLIAWVWGINGVTSVLGSTLAILMALLFGFSTVAYIGAGLYGLALVLAGRLGATAKGSNALPVPGAIPVDFEA